MEVMLDIEMAAAVAPGATIAVYFAPNTDQGFIDAVSTAIHDATNRPSVVSISWGGPESTWTSQAMNEMESAFAAGGTMGVTVTVASGDNGSTDGVSDGLQHVDFPASAPHALGCGGTSLSGTSEVVWDTPGDGAGGGGVSVQFPLPSYQTDAGVPVSANPGGQAGRGVPDVAGDADPNTGYSMRADGQDTVVGGTSAVAPLWAGLVARLNQALGSPVGFRARPSLRHPRLVPRHHFGQQRRLPGGARLGPVHRPRVSRWQRHPDGPAGTRPGRLIGPTSSSCLLMLRARPSPGHPPAGAGRRAGSWTPVPGASSAGDSPLPTPSAGSTGSRTSGEDRYGRRFQVDASCIGVGQGPRQGG